MLAGLCGSFQDHLAAKGCLGFVILIYKTRGYQNYWQRCIFLKTSAAVAAAVAAASSAAVAAAVASAVAAAFAAAILFYASLDEI